MQYPVFLVTKFFMVNILFFREMSLENSGDYLGDVQMNPLWLVMFYSVCYQVVGISDLLFTPKSGMWHLPNFPKGALANSTTNQTELLKEQEYDSCNIEKTE